MRNPLSYIYILILCAFCSCSSDKEYDRLLDAIGHQDEYKRAKEERILSIQHMLVCASNDAERYMLNDKLYDEYIAYRIDSAKVYVNRNLALSRKMEDKQREQLTIMHNVHIIAISGLFEEAEKIFHTVDTTLLDKDGMLDYYYLNLELEMYRSDYYLGTDYHAIHSQKVSEIRNHILTITPKGSYYYTLSYIFRIDAQGKHKDAIDTLIKYLRTSGLKSGMRQYSIIAYIISTLYKNMGKLDDAEHWCVESGISDVKGCIFENISKAAIADILFDKGEIDKAYEMLGISLDDAFFFGTRQRNLHASRLTHKIIAAYETKEKNIQKTITTALASISVLAILLIIAVVIIIGVLRRYKHEHAEVKLVNCELHDALERMKVMNEQLKKTSKIKNGYLIRFMTLCSRFLEIHDSNVKKSIRLIRDHKVDELYNLLKNSAFTNDMVHLLNKNFDEAFLNIYPDFIEELNKLLLPEGQVAMKEGGRLSTEVRILALIRLGITDNSAIASILHSSITTIYTYRSKLRSRSINKETFEKDIQNISV